MFSSALRSYNSNISNNYTISSAATSTAGAWKIFDGKKKSTGKSVSVFVFDKKSLEISGGLNRGSGGTSLKRLHEEVVSRIKKEANMLAKLRHPSILELAEPIEDTRSGGLMFATEPVTISLACLLREQDDEDHPEGSLVRNRSVTQNGAERAARPLTVQLDELEIQKGMLQIAQGLEFLHESAGLVHGNLNPDAIFINGKSDWKIGSFGFAGPPDEPIKPTTILPLSLSEALYHEPRLPRSLQLDLDYTSPDFALDGKIAVSADMFSLGLLLIAIYNSPHQSPLQANCNLSTYKRLLSSVSTTPTTANNFLSNKPLSVTLKSSVLPQLITRKPAQRLSARDFKQCAFFDNILVSTIQFLDALPAKSSSEKSQFLRGLTKILDQFPPTVLEKKVLPALLDESKDRDLLALILQNVFTIIQFLTSAERVMTECLLPHLQDIFASVLVKGAHAERASTKDAGLAVVLDNIRLIGQRCSGLEFKTIMLPIILAGMESPVHSIVDKSLGTLPVVIAILDYSSIKNEVFPIVVSVFTKTNSLGIKVRALETFVILCGGSTTTELSCDDDLNGVINRSVHVKPKSATSVLDKFTIQDKIVPLLKGIKTKEPAVMMAALAVFRQVGSIADLEFIAFDILPLLWAFSLGPLLNLHQFQTFMELIKHLSARVEHEQTRKLREVGTSDLDTDSKIKPTMSGSTRDNGGLAEVSTTSASECDFESLVLGKKAGITAGQDDMLGDFHDSNTVAHASHPGSSHRSTLMTNAAHQHILSTAKPHSSYPQTVNSPSLGNWPVINAMHPGRTITPDNALAAQARGASSLNPVSAHSSVANLSHLSNHNFTKQVEAVSNTNQTQFTTINQAGTSSANMANHVTTNLSAFPSIQPAKPAPWPALMPTSLVTPPQTQAPGNFSPNQHKSSYQMTKPSVSNFPQFSINSPPSHLPLDAAFAPAENSLQSPNGKLGTGANHGLDAFQSLI